MPATAIAARVRSRTSAGTSASMIERTSARSASSSSGAGGSVRRWRSVWRTAPDCVETWKSSSPPAPTTYSVEPPPMSMTTTGSGAPAARSLVAPRNVSRASSSPGIVRASSPKLVAHASVNAGAVRRVAHGAREHGDGALGAQRVDRLAVLGEHGDDAVDRVVVQRRRSRRRPGRAA